ncbi:hypothetical protein JW756_00220 [Candidatus Woesearchaeota archaeon]|nr:hypothetical protein [Candidatus Woesearchaeota archaeon]
MQSFDVFGGDLKIRYKGSFDWGGLYRLIWQWMQKRQFRSHEKRYKDKIDTALGNEIEVDVWGEKEVSEYYKYKIIIAYHLWESREVPVIENGKQVMRMQGRIEIRLNGQVITDWQEKYNKNNTVQKLMELFLNKVVLKYEIDIKHIDPFDEDLHALESQIKKFLKIEADISSIGERKRESSG